MGDVGGVGGEGGAVEGGVEGSVGGEREGPVVARSAAGAGGDVGDGGCGGDSCDPSPAVVGHRRGCGAAGGVRRGGRCSRYCAQSSCSTDARHRDRRKGHAPRTVRRAGVAGASPRERVPVRQRHRHRHPRRGRAVGRRRHVRAGDRRTGGAGVGRLVEGERERARRGCGGSDGGRGDHGDGPGGAGQDGAAGKAAVDGGGFGGVLHGRLLSIRVRCAVPHPAVSARRVRRPCRTVVGPVAAPPPRVIAEPRNVCAPGERTPPRAGAAS